MDKIRAIYTVVHGPMEPGSPLLSFLKESMALLQSITEIRHASGAGIPVFKEKKSEETTVNQILLVGALQSTDLVNIVTVLDALLLHKGGPSMLAAEEKLGDDMIEIASSAIKTLNQAANLDLKMTQVTI
jgi:hypothetical protein